MKRSEPLWKRTAARKHCTEQLARARARVWSTLRYVSKKWPPNSEITWLASVPTKDDLLIYNKAQHGDLAMVKDTNAVYLFLNKAWIKLT